VAIFSIWANRQALNTENWVNTSDKVLQDPEVRQEVADYMAAQLFANVDVQAELSQKLPPKLQVLAGPAAGGLRQLAPQAADKALATPQFEAIWEDANRLAHENLLKVLNGGGDNVSTQNGEVVLDLNSLITNVADQLGISADVASKIPADAGQLTILKSDDISTAQNAAEGIRHLPIILTLLVALLYGLAIYLAGPRRREALRSVGIGFAVAGVIALLIRGFSGDYLVNNLTSQDSVHPAAEQVWSIGTSLLVTVAASAIAFGILLFLAALLAGPTRAASFLREQAAPYLRSQPWLVAGGAFILWLALLIWVPIAAFGKPIGILIFALLFAAGAAILWRQTLDEFPEAGASAQVKADPPAPDAPGPGGPGPDAA
jgi:hypothetical protein